MDGSIFNDGRINTLTRSITHEGDIWFPRNIVVHRPNNFELLQIEILVGNSVI